ncbi:MAG: hypothetical protein PUF78_09585, partial [Lachnospiraceae bacterium]|nr:hypothetical protein [Lachnospiraceae bacterium]
MLSILFSMMPAMSAHAVQGKTGIYFSSNSVKVGDSVQVTVTGTAIDQIRVTYTAGLLNLTGCSAPGYTASGSTISFLGNKAVLTFSAQKAGSAEIVVRANVSTGSSALMNISDPAAQSQPTEQKAETNAATTNGSDQQGSNQTAQPANGSDQNGSNQTASPANGTDQNTQNGQTEDPKQSTTSDGETTTQKAGNGSDSDEKAAPEKKTGIMETIQNALSALKDKIANIDPNTKLRILLVAGAVVVILLILCILSMFRHRKEDRESDPFDDDFRM